MNSPTRHPGSYRDPAGGIYEDGGRIYRTITQSALEDYRFVQSSGILSKLVAEGLLIASSELERDSLDWVDKSVEMVLEHPRLPFVSYPYEWPFPVLQQAALLHLDLQLRLLECDITLSDASAYNVQFIGHKPIFIDTLSLRPYKEGELWLAHKQYCEQFLNPLLLRAVTGISHNSWYRGGLEGIPTSDLAKLIPLRARLSWRMLSHVTLPARSQSSAAKISDENLRKIGEKKLPRAGFALMLRQLRKWIASLRPADRHTSVWSNYEQEHSYCAGAHEAKRRFVGEFIEKAKPRMVWDIGCNTGEYSALALAAGAENVIGFDFDQQALETAYGRARSDDLRFLPLLLDAANPSPDQGWRQQERSGLHNRASVDALIALAFEHHLAIGRNIPLDQVLEWLVSLAPSGVVEFVDLNDPTVKRMLTLRDFRPSSYSAESFATSLGRIARIVKQETVTASGRELFWYER